jgi:fibronectin type 3 domain-containing protein
MKNRVVPTIWGVLGLALTLPILACAPVSSSDPADELNSTLAPVPAVDKVAANGTTTASVVVTLKSSFDSAVSGKTVMLTSDRGALDTISAVNATSDDNGQALFTIRSSSPGPAVLTATDLTDGVTVTQTVTITFMAVVGLPAAPTGLSAVAGDAHITLTWAAASGAASYSVYRGTASSSYDPNPVALGITSTNFQDGGVVNGTSYYYVVRAVNGAGEGQSSNEASATPQAPPAAPTSLTAAGSDGQISLSWHSATGAASYTVHRGTSSGSYTTMVSGITATSYVQTGLTNGTTYYFVVTAENAAGESGDSNQASAIPGAPPSAPSGLTASAGNAQVSLSWSADPGASSYSIYSGTTSGSYPDTVATNVTGTSTTATGLVNGTTYYFVVVAVNGYGTSGHSNQASATPAAPLYQRVTPSFYTYASANSSSPANDSTCATANMSCRAIDAAGTGTGWQAVNQAYPWLQVNSGNVSTYWNVDHFTVTYSATKCGNGLVFSYQQPGTTAWTSIGTVACTAGSVQTVTVPLHAAAWGLSTQLNYATADSTFTVYDVQFWTL